MMNLDAYDTIQGVTVYNDNQSDVTFYLLPNTPMYRLDDQGRPVFKFVKYREPVDRPDGKRGGGMVIFDTALILPDALQAKVKEELQARVNKIYANRGQPAPEVRIAQITWFEGKAQLIIGSADGEFVEKVTNPGSPSLYGQLVTPFTVELTQEGATLFEQIMQGGGGAVQVTYDLTTIAALPPVEVWGHFFAEKFYSFYQTIKKDSGPYQTDTYQETVREQFIDSSSYDLQFNWGDLTDPKAQQTIKDWAERTMEDQIKNKMIANIDPQKDRGAVDDFDETTRDIAVSKLASFTLHYSESDPIEVHRLPGGTLVNITNLTDKSGKPIAWADYEVVVDLNDPFFKEIRAVGHVNAPFDVLPIFSVDLHYSYPGADPQDYTITGPDDLAKFNAFIQNDNWKYKYSYVVNYKNETRTLAQNDIETDRMAQTINVGDMGFLSVDVKTGAVNFDQVASIQVTMQYEDQANGVDLIRDEFTLDKNNKDCQFQKLIFQPVHNPYTYEVTFNMVDGKQFHIPPTQDHTQDLFINSPFHGVKTVGVRARGNLDTLVDQIFVDLTYTDATNNYTQTKSVALNKANPFFDWSFPVISELAGTVTYTQSIRYKDGSTEDVPQMTADRSTFFVGPQIIEVQVLPDLLDFTQLKLVKVSLEYKDDANSLDETHDVIFHKTPPPTTTTYDFTIRDASKKSFTWQATYFMADGTTKQSPVTTTADPTVIPDPSSI